MCIKLAFRPEKFFLDNKLINPIDLTFFFILASSQQTKLGEKLSYLDALEISFWDLSI